MSQDCFLNSKDGKNFGSSRGLSGLVRLSECNDEVKHHLISCHLSKEVFFGSNSKTSSLADLMISARQELRNTKSIPVMLPLYIKTLEGCQLHSGRGHSKLLRRCVHKA